MNLRFLSGYKTKGLSIIATFAQIFSVMQPQYSPICNAVSAICLSATPFTLREALTHIKVV